MKYTGYTLSLQEVPGEVSLAISISNCPFRCAGCHSAYLQTDVGYELTPEVFENLLVAYKSPHTGLYNITCVVFFGGEQHPIEFKNLADISKARGLKVCLYTGATLENTAKDVLDSCDYIKVGEYIANLGGLMKKTTNQKMYDLSCNEDITYKFWE